MARRGALGGFSIDLFGGGGVDSSVFNIASTASQSKSNEAYLALTRVETQWEAGQTDNQTYLAALGTYANSFKPDTSEYLNQQARVAATADRIERNVLVASVNAGNASLSDLLAYDQSKLSGMNPDSQEYLDRLGVVNSTQERLLNDEERDVNAVYSDGKMTTAQLQAWYKERAYDPRFFGNFAIGEDINAKIRELDGRIVDERDSQMVADYSAGKISPTAFLFYAGQARARYAEGTTEARNWDRRIESAGDAAVEDDLNYRYSLSQDYNRLAEFVASNKPPTGHTTTYTRKGEKQTRTVLGADGKWKTVSTTIGAGTSTKTYAPTKAELAAWEKRKIEVDAAKKQMASIASKVSGLPGGFVASTDMLGFYQKQLGDVAPNTSEWYQLQAKIDGINATIASEKVLARQGVKISYPKSGGAPTAPPKATGGGTAPPKATGGGSAPPKAAKSSGSVSLETFMAAIARTESGGRYEARNSKTGAYGKYQILPSNWSNWAQKAGLPANAKPTPENQDKVALNRFTHLYNKYDGDWTRMAAEWHAGAAGTAQGPGKGNWGPVTSHYVSTVLARAGTSYNPTHPVGTNAPRPSGATSSATAGARPSAAPPAGKSTSGASKGAPTLRIITGINQVAPKRGNVDPRLQSEMSYSKGWGLTTEKAGLPAGLTPDSFKLIYDGIESAFLSGEDAAVIRLGPKEELHLFIGDDPAEKIKFMREMDDMRIGLADQEVKTYKASHAPGKQSSTTKSNAAIVARREAAGHELIILDMVGEDVDGVTKTNPVASGIRLLDNVVGGVAQHTKLMNDAWAAGDTTGAVLQSLFIEQLLNPQSPVGDLRHMLDKVDAAQARIAQLAGKTGYSPTDLLKGMGPAGQAVQKDMDRLRNWGTEVDKVKTAGDDTDAEMENFVVRDASGKIVFINGQALEKPNVLKVLKPNGKVDRIIAEKGILQNGKPGYLPPEKTTLSMVNVGGHIVDAYAKYNVERVGTIKMPDGAEIPIMGKKITVTRDTDNNGVNDTTEVYFENPMSPGQWSSTPIVYKAPPGSVPRYLAGSDTPYVAFPIKGTKMIGSLILDPKTGVFVVNTEEPPSQIGGSSPSSTSGTPMTPVGTTFDSPDARDMVRGFSRDLSGLSPEDQYLSRQSTPVIGFAARDWARTQLPGAAGSSKYGPPVPESGYKPLGREINEFTGFTITTEQQQAANAKRRSDAAAANVAHRQSEIASGNTSPTTAPTTQFTGIPIPKKPVGALGVNINADLAAVDAKIGGYIKPAPPKPAPAKPAASKPSTSTPFVTPIGGQYAPPPKPKVITPLPKPANTKVATTTTRVAQ